MDKYIVRCLIEAEGGDVTESQITTMALSVEHALEIAERIGKNCKQQVVWDTPQRLFA